LNPEASFYFCYKEAAAIYAVIKHYRLCLLMNVSITNKTKIVSTKGNQRNQRTQMLFQDGHKTLLESTTAFI